jgi:general secretion pathway protein K
MKSHQQGVAIVLAMGVVALSAMAATAMMVTQSTWSRQVELATGHVQSQLILQAGLDWARSVLSDDRRISNVDYPGEIWALRLAPIPIDNGSLTGLMEDQQGKFNLNNLLKNGKVNLLQLAHFRRLLSIMAMPATLADALAEWMETDNQTLLDVGELAQVPGFEDKVLTRLRQFVTALPRFTPVNANTASPEVLAAVIEGLSLDDARALVAQRERSHFISYADFIRFLPTGLIAPSENISVGSEYFLATMRVSIGGAQARGSALLVREKSAWPAIVWRKNL